MQEKPRKSHLGVILAIVAGLLLMMGLAGVALIKFNTGGAAEFTDNVLRPLLGPEIVIGLEKIFFNTSDKLKQTAYLLNPTGGVDFVEEGATSDQKNSSLSLATIEELPGLSREKSEGIWKNRKLALFPDKEVMAYTYVRPDPARPFAYVTLVQMDMNEMKLGAVAGTVQPGGPVGNPGPGMVPAELANSGKLIAAFDGGFQYRDGAYGMVVGDKTYLPLKPDLATLVGFKNGSLKLFEYTNQLIGGQVEFIRQNCPILVTGGKVAIYDEANKKLWGRTMTSGIYTWRSGLGLTKQGNLLYAVGNNLTPETLAIALKMGGAVEAMQLDINPYWVRFNIFDNDGQGGYKISTLTKDLKDGSQAYLHGYSKDFFYVYKR